IFIFNSIQKERNEKFLKRFFLNTPLVLSPYVFLIQTKWNWIDRDEWRFNYQKHKSEFYTISIRTPLGSSERLINYLSYQIFFSFKTKGTLNEKLKDLIQQLSPETKEETLQLKRFILQQSKQAIKENLIIISS